MEIALADVGAAPENFAVTALRLEADTLIASVRNIAADTRDAPVRLNVGESTDAVLPAAPVSERTIPVGGYQSVDIAFATPPGRWARVAVEDRRGAEGDNARYVVLETSLRPKVLVVTATGDIPREAFYVQQALAAGGAAARAYEVEGTSGADLQGWESSRLEAHTAVILLSTRGLDHRGRTLVADFARKGGGVLVSAASGADAEVISDALGGLPISVAPQGAGQGAGQGAADIVRTLAPADVRHPVLQMFGARSALGLVRFRRIAVLRTDQCATLARFTTGEPAILDCEVGLGKGLLFASDLDNDGNDFPLHPSFVPFLHETIRYLSGGRRLAEYLVGQVPGGVPPVPGVAALARGMSAAATLVAVNVDPAESDERRLSAAEFQSAVSRMQTAPAAASEQDVEAGQREERQHLWQYVLVGMMALLIAESVLAARTA
jgi:hypothetical protein